jgi:hypothetical protein
MSNKHACRGDADAHLDGGELEPTELVFEELEARTLPGVDILIHGGCATSCSCDCTSCSCIGWAA